ncbi:auxin response factor 8-like isoform X1 [Olea europaea subsp. europaea]|uniref:Auxin response factor 8-like isoform X1 n=1 Tax=Olea europaea subsp. europaea TaxID=158383 RepID=A0A8S0V3K0_OLEEU|nr:auxin response factor 8-like isoform X1 [Olea europaea subsp. europaea]
MPSSVLSSDSMHIGLLAAAAHAAATNSCFTVFYNPRLQSLSSSKLSSYFILLLLNAYYFRASPSEFVIPLSKYVKAVYHTCVSVGMRFRMLFETDESTVRRYMGTVTGIGYLDPTRWPNSHWRSVKVGWDESTASERQPRVSLWEIEPLTTFPMYPSLFPLRLKRPWYPGASSLQGDTAEQGLSSMKFQSASMFPWMQPIFDPTILRNDLNQQYQAMTATGLQNFGTGDTLKHQLSQFQQPVRYLQHPGSHNLLSEQQQLTEQSISSHMFPTQNQMLSDNLQGSEEHPQQHTYQEAFPIQNDQFRQRQPLDIPSPSFTKSNFTNSNRKFSASITPYHVQNMLGSLCSEGNGNLLNLSRSSQAMLNVQSHHQPWVMKFAQSPMGDCSNSTSFPPYPGKDASCEQETCTVDAHNHTLFHANTDSSRFLLPTTVSGVSPSSHANMSSMPLDDPVFQNSHYSYEHDSSELLHSTGQVDPPISTRTFVKVHKSGSVGRSLDITQFHSYHELRRELGQMFGIEGLLEDPQRSGWQLVFVDEENDVLLLGDGPWEAFVNNVWYIKILSPEDVLNLGNERQDPWVEVPLK